MKKSTLITTIAMIVVVVVALSTATYAWFTAQSTSTTSGQMNVTSQSTWSIMGATQSAPDQNADSSDVVAFNASQDIKLILMNGLYSPTAEITGTIAGNTLSTTFSSFSSFYKATQSGTGNVTTAKAAEAATVDPIIETPTNVRSSISYMRVENGANSAQELRLTITIWIASSATSIQKAAAQEFCTYISYNTKEYTNAQDLVGSDAGYKAYTKYDYGDLSGEDAPYTATKVGAANAYSVAASTDTTGKKALGGNTTYTVGNLATTYTGEDAELTDGQYYQLYLDFGSIRPGDAVNIAMYSWFNGWKIDNTATGTNAYVYLSFATAPAAQQGQGA